jgi:hypothetical protein
VDKLNKTELGMRGGKVNQDKRNSFMDLMILLRRLKVISQAEYDERCYFEVNPLVSAHKLFVEPFKK